MFENSCEPALEFIFGFSHSGSPVKDLGRTERLLAAVGDPQERLRFVHIAGTNGKGSAAKMFDGVFIEAGLRTGLFTSPYIIEYADRIQVNDRNIPYGDLARLAERVRCAVEGMPEKTEFSQFEITLAIGLLYFEEQGCDVVVLETGLGGLLDCTNIVKRPLLTVITSVGLDHTAVLGDTEEKIAGQKAGIIKKGVPCVLSCGNSDTVRKVVAERAREMSAELIIPDESRLEIQYRFKTRTFFRYKNESYCVNMLGRHQVVNAMTVIEGCHALGRTLGLGEWEISEGISEAVLHGRTEVLSESPLTILDGGHNPDGLRALAEIVREIGLPCRAVIGMCRDKDMREAVSGLIPVAESFVTVDGFSERAESAEALAELINGLGGKAAAGGKGLAEEIEALRRENSGGLTLICGSLYLTSAVHGLVREKKLLS